jgi:hypothetical protein
VKPYSGENQAEQIGLFEHALALDPESVEAQSRLAGSLVGRVEFTLPETVGGWCWQLLIDTNLPEDAVMGRFATGEVYGVTGRSLLLFVLQIDDRARLQGFAGS